MKILYVGSLSDQGNSAGRCWALEALGHRVFALEAFPRGALSRRTNIVNRLSWLAGRPKDVGGANGKLLALARSEQPDVVWVDKGVMIRRDTLQAVRRSVQNVALAHFNPDDPFGPGWRRGWRTFLEAVPEYDCHFVSRAANVTEYEQRGARRVVHDLPGWGFDSRIHRPYDLDAQTRAQFGCDVGFIGAFEVPRASMLLALAQAGIGARIWGPWPRKFWHARLHIETQPLFGEAYGKAISSFKIALCFLRKYNRDGHTVRSTEIPACGTLMLAERTEDHLALFEEGKEAAFFSSTEELVDKVRYYLDHDADRTRLAAAGRERCLQSGYSNEALMKKRIATLARPV